MAKRRERKRTKNMGMSEEKKIVETKKVPLRWMELYMLFLTESNPFFKVTNDLKIFLPLMIYLLVSRLPSITHKPLCTFVFGWIKYTHKHSYSHTDWEQHQRPQRVGSDGSSGNVDGGSNCKGNSIHRHQTPLHLDIPHPPAFFFVSLETLVNRYWDEDEGGCLIK